MTIEALARFQFAMTTIFHFFFVPFSIGMCLIVAILETCYVVTKNEDYKKLTKFWGNMMLLSFAVGVVTGIIQEFQFGMNWSDYSRFVGDIFGAPLAVEALLAFFMESTFLGLWMFTWDNQKVSKKVHLSFIWLVVFGSLAVMGAGDLQMKALLHEQPMKFAAMEGDYKDSGDPAAWTVVAWANEADKKQVFSIKVPYMLSILSYGKPSGAVPGMNTANKDLIKKYGERNYFPMVNLLFYSFRLMAGFGMLMLGVSVLGLFLTRKKKPVLYQQKWLLRIMALTTFAPFIANTLGWIITEQGRYPWTVYGLFTIKDSVSPNVSVASLLISNSVYFVLFSGLGAMMVSLVIRELHKGPEHEEAHLSVASQSSIDPFEKGAY